MSPGKTRERLITAAMKLFYVKGYEATSVAEILEQAGAGSGSLYYFFRDKQDLALAVARHYREILFDVLFAPVYETVEDPIERIFALLNNYRRGLVESDFVYGCPIGNLSLEISESLPEVRQKLGENFDGWIEHVRICLEDARHRFPDNVDFHGLATLVLTTMEGGVMVSRAKKNIEPFDTAVKQLRTYINQLMKPASE